MKKIFILILAVVTFSISYVLAETAVENAKEKKDQFIEKMDQEITQLSNEIESLRLKAKDKSKATVGRL